MYKVRICRHSSPVRPLDFPQLSLHLTVRHDTLLEHTSSPARPVNHVLDTRYTPCAMRQVGGATL